MNDKKSDQPSARPPASKENLEDDVKSNQPSAWTPSAPTETLEDVLKRKNRGGTNRTHPLVADLDYRIGQLVLALNAESDESKKDIFRNEIVRLNDLKKGLLGKSQDSVE